MLGVTVTPLCAIASHMLVYRAIVIVPDSVLHSEAGTSPWIVHKEATDTQGLY